MTALAEALLAAQRQAIGALSKAYVAGAIDSAALVDEANKIGATDTVDQAHLLAALDVLKTYGTAAPTPAPESRKAPAPMTKPQRAKIEVTCKERGLPLPVDLERLSVSQASDVIKSLNDGTYDHNAILQPF